MNLALLYEPSDELFLKALIRNFTILERIGLVHQIWHPGMVSAGEDRKKAVQRQLRDMDLILPLISVDFIASDECYVDQLDLAMLLHKDGKTLLVPILIRKCLWKLTSISWLNPLPSNQLPVDSPEWETADQPYVEITQKVKEIIEEKGELISEILESTDHTVFMPSLVIKDDLKTSHSFLGQSIFGCQIEHFIASGGFGSVYRAQTLSGQQKRAIKISHKIRTGVKELETIVDAGLEALKILDHPNIVKTYEVHKVDYGDYSRVFILMEYIRGGTLADYSKYDLKEEDIDRIIHIFGKICKAIEYAHSVTYPDENGQKVTGIKHGDIKLSNVLLSPEGEPKVMDFMFIDVDQLEGLKLDEVFEQGTLISGAAPTVVGNPLPPTQVDQPDKKTVILSTSEGRTRIFGTPGYMPREQSREGVISQKTDIYTLGILLFEMLHPYRFSGYQFDNAQQILEQLRNYNPSIPEKIGQVVWKSTQTEPEKRYPGVNELLEDLPG